MMKMIKLLIIEDDSVLRSGLEEILVGEGYEVDTADNGITGLKLFENKKHDIVLTDLVMPAMNGMEVLKEVSKINPKTHVVVITAFATVENAVEAIKLGAADYISKPFKIDEIQTKIKKILEEAKFEKTTAPALDSDSIKALANVIRKDVVSLLYKHEKLKFTEIQHHLKIKDATKLSFHLRVLKSAGILDQDSNKVYMLAPKGKKLLEALGNL